MSISMGLLVLIFLEAVFTEGSAFKFSNYNTFSWIAQCIGVVFTVSLSAHVAGNMEQ
jgi:hypothetical protein